jgi:glycerate kinase|tara:strand:- start:6682 stop:7818 length:1137 start_codon:yes stop_codon:yes gene_type:complete
LNVLIIPDSFKGSLTATEVAKIMAKKVKQLFPKSTCHTMPFSDGGEGALKVLEEHATGTIINCEATDALSRPIKANYFLFKDQKSAWIELSKTAGLTQIKEADRNPLKTSTIGTGKMIFHALNKGCTTLYLGIGGSATQDIGCGIIHALGGKFIDSKGKGLSPNGANLINIETIDLSEIDPRIFKMKWIIGCDVQNTLLGINGSAHTYAKQKGATPEMINELEEGGRHFTEIVERQFGKKIDQLTGGGAAGGVSAGLFGVFNACLEEGFELLAKQTQLKSLIKQMDLVITGEGNYDVQSTFGKLPFQVAQLTKQLNIPTLLFAGKTKIKAVKEMPHLMIYQTKPQEMSTKEAMKKAAENLSIKLTEVLQEYKTTKLIL